MSVAYFIIIIILPTYSSFVWFEYVLFSVKVNKNAQINFASFAQHTLFALNKNTYTTLTCLCAVSTKHIITPSSLLVSSFCEQTFIVSPQRWRKHWFRLIHYQLCISPSGNFQATRLLRVLSFIFHFSSARIIARLKRCRPRNLKIHHGIALWYKTVSIYMLSYRKCFVDLRNGLAALQSVVGENVPLLMDPLDAHFRQ